MDTGAQPDAPDTGGPTSGAGTAEDAGACDKSVGTDKGKAPEVPEVQTDPAPASAGQAAPATPEQPAPKTPTTEKTTAPAKTVVPAKSGTAKIKQIIRTGTQSAVTAPASAKPAPSISAMTLHFGKAAARPSFFETPELEGRVSLLTKSDKSLGSLKEYCTKWNDANFMDTASSKKKKMAKAAANGNPVAILAAKPIPIASELLNIQQRLHLLADATNVSVLPYISPVPENVGCPGYGHPGFSYSLLHLAVFKSTARHISSIRASNPSHRGPG
jgi:hypothetical protein